MNYKDMTPDELRKEAEAEIDYMMTAPEQKIYHNAKVRFDYAVYNLEKIHRDKLITTLNRNSRISSKQNILMIVLTAAIFALTAVMVYYMICY